MSYLEDEIRGALRTEAGRLREVRPLRLPPAVAQDEPRAVHGASLARRLSAWRGPLAAAAAVVIIAAVLVIVRSVGNEHAAPVAPPTPIAGAPLPADATPRYYVKIGVANKSGWVIIVGDEQTGRTIATYPLHLGRAMWSSGVSGAGDDRTFVVSVGGGDSLGGGGLTPGQTRPLVLPPPTWYLVRIFPGAASPVRMTRLAVNFTTGGAVREIALSADGTELAVLSETSNATLSETGKHAVLSETDKSTVLGIYSVATGQLQHSWSAPLGASAANNAPGSDLSWAGDGTVGFAVTDTPGVREEVRTLDAGAGGTSLLAASRVVWSQYVPAPPRGSNPYHAPQACSTPFLTGNGQAVVCATSSYSAHDNRQTALWLAYPLATPDRPRVIGSVPQPQDVNKFNSVGVDWTNPSGTEIIGDWNPNVDSVSDGEKAQTVTNFTGFIGHGSIRPFGPVFGLDVAW
jgi:hypothetical protein